MAAFRCILLSMYLLILVMSLLSSSSSERSQLKWKKNGKPRGTKWKILEDYERWSKPTIKTTTESRNTDSIINSKSRNHQNKNTNGGSVICTTITTSFSNNYDRGKRKRGKKGKKGKRGKRGKKKNPTLTPRKKNKATPTTKSNSRNGKGNGNKRSSLPTVRGSKNKDGPKPTSKSNNKGNPKPTDRRSAGKGRKVDSKRKSPTPTPKGRGGKGNGRSSSTNKGGPKPTSKSNNKGNPKPTDRRSTGKGKQVDSNRRSSTPTPKSRGGKGNGRSSRSTSTPTHRSRGNNGGDNNRGNNNGKKLTPSEVHKELKKLSKNKVNQNNAKEVARNLNKVFKQSRPKDVSKDDADAAADIMENIISITERLNETADEVIDLIDTLMEINKTTLAESETASMKIIKALYTLVQHIPLDEDTASKQINKTNIIIQANQVQSKTFQGISFGIKTNQRISVVDDTVTEDDTSNTFIKLPRAVLSNTNMTSVRIGFIYYANNKLFQAINVSEGKSVKVESSQAILASTVYSGSISNLTDPVRVRFPLHSGRNVDYRKNTSECVFWVESARQWSSFGCSLCAKQGSKDSVECCCNHLTSFAVLFSPVKGKSSANNDVHAKVLSIISYVGCVISIFGVVLTFFTYSVFRHLRKTNQQPILMNLCVAIALLLIVFVAGVNTTNNRLGCQIVAVLLHYLTLVTVLWMGIEAYNLYLQIVKVMAIYHRRFMLKASLVGWGVPFLVVMATLAAAIIQYKQKYGNITFYYGNDQVCILHNQLYWTISWFGPALAILFMNLVAFIFIIYKLTSRHTMLPVEPKSKHMKNCWTSLAIMVLLGLTWLFGALAIFDARIVFEYLFCIFNSLQGFFIFFFHCVRIKEVRNQWSFFVSGLGFSHGNSENSQQKSRGMDNNPKNSDSINMQNVENNCQVNDTEHAQQKRKVTTVTMVGDTQYQ